MTNSRALPLPSLRSAGRVAIAAVALFAVAAQAARPSLNIYFQSTLKDAAYQKQVFQKVAGAWKSPSSFPAVGKKCVVQAILGKDGRVQSAFVSMESGVKAWDVAGLAAVHKAAPYPPLPASLGQKTLEAHFHFAVVP